MPPHRSLRAGRQPGTDGSGRASRASSGQRFAETFARHPALPRLGLLPSRRAWSSTAVAAAVVAGIAFTAPLLTQRGLDRSEAVAASSATITPVGPSADPSTSPGRPKIGQLTTTPVGPPGSPPSQPSGVLTVTGPPATVTVTTIPPPGQKPPALTTAHPPVKNLPRTGATTTPNPPRVATSRSTAKPPVVAAVPPSGVRVQNYGSNRCIDVKGAQSGVGKDGTPLQLWDCAQSSNQRWTFNSDGTVRSLGLCMDLAWASTDENTQVQLVNCNGGWAQKFALNTAHDLVNPTAGKCVTADSTGNGARLVLRSCADTTNQKWHKA